MYSHPPDPLRLSDRAQSKIRELMKDDAPQSRSRSSRVRVYAERGTDGELSLALAFDRQRAHDVTVDADGVVVVADPESLAIAADRVLDYGADGFTLAPSSACQSHSITE